MLTGKKKKIVWEIGHNQMQVIKQLIRNMNWKPMKIAKSVHKKVRLLNEKDDYAKKVYNYNICNSVIMHSIVMYNSISM